MRMSKRFAAAVAADRHMVHAPRKRRLIPPAPSPLWCRSRPAARSTRPDGFLPSSLQARLGQSFVVENRTGAGAVIGTSYVAKAPPDGYTLLLMESSAPLAKWIYKTPPFDLMQRFHADRAGRRQSAGPVCQRVVSRQRPEGADRVCQGQPRQGLAPGVSGMSHQLTAHMLNSAAGVQMTPVPYRGTAPAVNDLVSGTIPLLWSTPVGLMQFVENGKLRALAVSTPKRVSLLPDVPALSEHFPGFIWKHGLASPDPPACRTM